MFGKIVDVNIMRRRSRRTNRSRALVRYSRKAESDECVKQMQAYEYTPGDGYLKVRSAFHRGPSKDKGKGKGKGKGGKGEKGKGKGGKGKVGKSKAKVVTWQ